MRLLLVGLLAASVAFAIDPAAIAPGAPELDDAEGRLRHLLKMSVATGDAVTRMQSTWALLPGGDTRSCDDEVRLQLGWRIERFGAAWREAAQASRVQASRLHAMQRSPTVLPLVDDTWTSRLDGLEADVDREVRGFLAASAWEKQFVRPWIEACPTVELAQHPGLPSNAVKAAEDLATPTAVLGLGDGWVCPARVRADGGVAFVDDGRACWAPDSSCQCEPVPVNPGAVLGAPAPEPALPAAEAAPPPEPTPPKPAATSSPRPAPKPKAPRPKGPPAP